jgi:alcohol dehydrogenase class IV
VFIPAASENQIPDQLMSGDGSIETLIRGAEQSSTLVVTSNTGLSVLGRLAVAPSIQVVKVPPGEPELRGLDSLLSSLQEIPDVIIALGGGAVIDYGKLIALHFQFPEIIETLRTAPTAQVRISASRLGLDLVAVPTTLGSGAEVSSSAIVKIGARGKVAVAGRALRPSGHVLDPSLIDPVTNNSAPGLVDLIAHSLESLLSSRKSRVLDIASGESIKTVMELSDYEELSESDRFRLQLASSSAGYCQDLRLVGIPHALAHLFPFAPHGIVVGWFLFPFLTNLKRVLPEAYDVLQLRLGEVGVTYTDLVNKVGALVNLAQFDRDSLNDFVMDESTFKLFSQDSTLRLFRFRVTPRQLEDFNFPNLKIVGLL